MTDEKRIILATTFSRAEVNALVFLLATLDRRGDVRDLLKSAAVISLRKKFLKMRAKAER